MSAEELKNMMELLTATRVRLDRVEEDVDLIATAPDGSWIWDYIKWLEGRIEDLEARVRP